MAAESRPFMLPLPLGEGWGEGLCITPHPHPAFGHPLPEGEGLMEGLAGLTTSVGNAPTAFPTKDFSLSQKEKLFAGP